MSSSDTDAEPRSEFGATLRDARTALRRSDLRNRLDEQAEILREYLLLAAVHEALTGESQTLDAMVRDSIQDVRTHIETQEFSSIEAELDTLEPAVKSERNEVEQAVKEHCISVGNTLDAMEKLNERVGNVNPDRISNLQDRYDGLTSLSFVEEGSIVDQQASIEGEIRDLEADLAAVQEDVFGQFYETDLEEIVRQLLNDKAFRIDDLSTDQFERLRESELADCIEVLLS